MRYSSFRAESQFHFSYDGLVQEGHLTGTERRNIFKSFDFSITRYFKMTWMMEKKCNNVPVNSAFTLESNKLLMFLLVLLVGVACPSSENGLVGMVQ